MTRAQHSEHERQVAEFLRNHGVDPGAVSEEERKSRKRAHIQREAEEWDEDAGAAMFSRSDSDIYFDDSGDMCAVHTAHSSSDGACPMCGTGTALERRLTDEAVERICEIAVELGAWAGKRDPVKRYAVDVALHRRTEDTRGAAMELKKSERFIRSRVSEARRIVKSHPLGCR